MNFRINQSLLMMKAAESSTVKPNMPADWGLLIRLYSRPAAGCTWIKAHSVWQNGKMGIRPSGESILSLTPTLPAYAWRTWCPVKPSIMHEHLRAASTQERSQSIHVSSAILYNAVYECCIIAEALLRIAASSWFLSPLWSVCHCSPSFWSLPEQNLENWKY